MTRAALHGKITQSVTAPGGREAGLPNHPGWKQSFHHAESRLQAGQGVGCGLSARALPVQTEI